MAALTQQQKVFVVQHLGAFYSLSEVRDLFQEAYGALLDTAQIARYNPTIAAGSSLSESLREEFVRSRRAFLEDRSGIAIAQTNYRLRELDGLYRRVRSERNPNIVLALSILEQAAQDDGGKYTNKREISGPGGKPIVITQPARDVAAQELDAWRKQQAASLGDLLTAPTDPGE